MDKLSKLSTPEILAAIADGLADWRRMAQPVVARYRVPGLGEGAAFVAAVAEAAGSAGREPELRLGPGFVEVALCTVGADGGRWVTAADLDLARTVSDLAARHGLRATPGDIAQLELGLDATDFDRVAPFWSALLTGSPDHVVHGDVMDPAQRVPNVWFQRTDAHETPRQRWHPDLWLAPEEAEPRIRAALAAGGVLVARPDVSFTVLADPEGNRVCVCTAEGRE
ncbi:MULTISPECIES: VOC family protein [unclassified Streptomyces]|uniref:VOC family protein n=1 Tax=unclassified Streptomyces TaxID=2593676 RepID=UPI000DBA43CE|nr:MULTISPECIES: VOC family protein [unclassified Streptomyces]MYT72144.1 4a-hydroxytetrahydrobiopterin dehydratase [Streptomyces sp. SID8367]RAJ81555.1 4a-hydroxytetrahydrobiopterin dehydratase [Streptomyces sp. PsTaAH-137]